MLVIVGAIAGAVWGALLARARKGSRMDMAQYAGGFGIAFALLGLFATLMLDRMIG